MSNTEYPFVSSISVDAKNLSGWGINHDKQSIKFANSTDVWDALIKARDNHIPININLTMGDHKIHAEGAIIASIKLTQELTRD